MPLLERRGWRAILCVGPHPLSCLREVSSCSFPCIPDQLACKFLNSPVSAQTSSHRGPGSTSLLYGIWLFCGSWDSEASPPTWVALYPLRCLTGPYLPLHSYILTTMSVQLFYIVTHSQQCLFSYFHFVSSFNNLLLSCCFPGPRISFTAS